MRLIVRRDASLWIEVGVSLASAFMASGFSFTYAGPNAGAPQGPRNGPPPTIAPAPAPAPAAAPSIPFDRFGDPLPRYARLRLGTVRFNAGQAVEEVHFAGGGKLLVTLADGKVQVWDVASQQVVRFIGNSQNGIGQIAVSADGKTLATIEAPGRLRLWDVASGAEQRRWHALEGQYEWLTFSPDGRAVAAGVTTYDEASSQHDKFINIWDLTAPTERRRRINGDWVELRGLAFAPDGKTLVSCGNGTKPGTGGSLRIWDVATGKEQLRIAVEDSSVWSVAASPDGRVVAAGVADQTIRIFDVATGQERLPRLGAGQATRVEPAAHGPAFGAPGKRHAPATTVLAFSPDGSLLASGAGAPGVSGSPARADVYLWDVVHGKELRHFPAHQGWITSLCFAPDGKTLVSTGADVAIRLWDVAAGREAGHRPVQHSWIRALAVSPADGTIWTGNQDGAIRQWDPATSHEIGVLAALDSPPDALAFAPDGKTLLVGGSMGGRFALWSIALAREIRSFPRDVPRNPVRHVAFSPDGKTVASERRIWDISTGTVLATFRDPDADNNASANFFPIFYSADGKQVLTCENEGLRVWDIAAGKPARWAIRAPIHHDRAALSADRRLLATGGVVGHFTGGPVDPPIRVWELASGQEVLTLLGPEESTNSLCFSPDGRVLATGGGSHQSSNDATVRIWDVATGRELRRCDGHRAQILAVAFTPDGRSVVSGSADSTALVWDVSDLKSESDAAAAESIDRKALEARWNELAGGDARAAYRASWALSSPSGVAFLRERIQPAVSADPDGVPAAIGPIAPPEILRTLRAIAALERAGTPDARAVIEQLVHGNPGASATRDAQAAIERMNHSRTTP